MTDPETPDSRPGPTIDWEATRARVRSRILAQLGRDDGSADDLTQEALIRILRIARREPILSLEGLIQRVARATVIDEIRRRQRVRAKRSDWEASRDQIETLPQPDKTDGLDSVEFIWFFMVEFLRRHKAPCYALAMAYVDLGDWKRVAESRGQSYDAVRQQWSRCTRAFRDAMNSDLGPLKDWFDGA